MFVQSRGIIDCIYLFLHPSAILWKDESYDA